MDSDDDDDKPRPSLTTVHLENNQVYKVHCEECFGDFTLGGQTNTI